MTWEDKKLKIDQKPVFRRAEDGAMRHALLPVAAVWGSRAVVFDVLRSPADTVV